MMEKNRLSNKTLDQVIAAIWMLDLAPIKYKLMDAEEGYGWSREFADRNEIEYKRFLTLLVKYPDRLIAPDKNVDRFWHGHILDTLKYAEDCSKVFGYFLHHFPYFGMRGPDDAARLAAAATTMRDLHLQEFGEPAPAQAAAFCGAANNASFCGAANAVSFCGATNAVSFCGATTSEKFNAPGYSQGISFCGAANNVSFCGAANAGHPDNTPVPGHMVKAALRPDWRPQL